MVTIPQPQPRGQPVGSITPRVAETPFSNVRPADTSAAGRTLAQMGEAVTGVAFELQARRDEAIARAAQELLDETNLSLYDPDTGLFRRQGLSARGMSDEVGAIYDNLREQIDFEGMSRSGRVAFEETLRQQRASAVLNAQTYEMQQLEAGIARQRQTRVDNAARRAAANPYDPDAFIASLGQAAEAARLNVLSRDENATEEADAAALAATTTVVLSRVGALANQSAQAALQALEDANDVGGLIDPAKFNETYARLQPLARDERLEDVAEAAAAADLYGTGALGPTGNQLMTQFEGGSGGYSALYQQAQNHAFAGVDVTQMTLNELLAFSTPSGEYGSWVRANLDPDSYAAQNNLTSTPMGKYQIVGSTLETLIDAMGLTGDELFSPALQDAMAAYLVGDAISRAGGSMAQARANIRGVWEGLSDPTVVSDDQLDAMIREHTAGAAASEGVTGQDIINQIPDLTDRADAQAKYERIIAANQRAEQRVNDAAVEGLVTEIDYAFANNAPQMETMSFMNWLRENNSVGTYTELPVQDQNRLRGYFESVAAGERIETDLGYQQQINEMVSGSAAAQQAFLEMDFESLENRTRLSRNDRQAFMTLQTAMRQAPQTTIAAVTPETNTVRNAVDNVLRSSVEQGLLDIDVDNEALYNDYLDRQTARTMSFMIDQGLAQNRLTPWTFPEIREYAQLAATVVELPTQRRDSMRSGDAAAERERLGVEAIPELSGAPEQIYRKLEEGNFTADDLAYAVQNRELIIDGRVIDPSSYQRAVDDAVALGTAAGTGKPTAAEVFNSLWYLYLQSPGALINLEQTLRNVETSIGAGADESAAELEERAAAANAAAADVPVTEVPPSPPPPQTPTITGPGPTRPADTGTIDTSVAFGSLPDDVKAQLEGIASRQGRASGEELWASANQDQRARILNNLIGR